MRCRTALTRVDALRTGELEAPEQSVVDEHLKKCGSCNESFHDVERLARAVKSLALPSPRSFRDIAPHDSCTSDRATGRPQTARVRRND